MAFHLCSTWMRHHLGPLIIIAVGLGFAVVGAIPVAVNFSIGANNSSTIIGVGFIGFGLLLMVPGLCWCVVLRLVGLKSVCDCRCCCCCYGDDRGRWVDAENMEDSREMMSAIETRPSRSNSTEADDASPSSAHNKCIFTEEDEDEARNKETKEKEAGGGGGGGGEGGIPDGVIVIPVIHKASPLR